MSADDVCQYCRHTRVHHESGVGYCADGIMHEGLYYRCTCWRFHEKDEALLLDDDQQESAP